MVLTPCQVTNVRLYLEASCEKPFFGVDQSLKEHATSCYRLLTVGLLGLCQHEFAEKTGSRCSSRFNRDVFKVEGFLSHFVRHCLPTIFPTAKRTVNRLPRLCLGRSP